MDFGTEDLDMSMESIKDWLSFSDEVEYFHALFINYRVHSGIYIKSKMGRLLAVVLPHAASPAKEKEKKV